MQRSDNSGDSPLPSMSKWSQSRVFKTDLSDGDTDNATPIDTISMAPPQTSPPLPRTAPASNATNVKKESAVSDPKLSPLREGTAAPLEPAAVGGSCSASNDAERKLAFSTSEAARHWREPRTSRPKMDNDDLEVVEQNKTAWVRRMLDAMAAGYSNSPSGKPQKMDATMYQKQWVDRQSSADWSKFEPKTEEEWRKAAKTVWMLLDEVLTIHVEGFPEGTLDREEQLTCSARLEAMIKTIRDYAYVRVDIVQKSTKLLGLAAAPEKYGARKVANMKSNVTRKSRPRRKSTDITPAADAATPAADAATPAANAATPAQHAHHHDGGGMGGHVSLVEGSYDKPIKLESSDEGDA